MFIIRAVFWLTVIVFLLPQAPESAAGGAAGAKATPAVRTQAVETPAIQKKAVTSKPVSEAEAAAKSVTVTATSTEGLVHFCERNAQTCTTAGSLAVDFKDAAIDAYRNAGNWIAVLQEDQKSKPTAAQIAAKTAKDA